MPPFDAPPRPRTSDEEDEYEEVEFKLAEQKTEEKPWFSLNKCIVGAVILLFLGSLFLSGEFLSCLTKSAYLSLLSAQTCNFSSKLLQAAC